MPDISRPAGPAALSFPDIAFIKATLQKCAAGIDRVCAETESDFLELGSRLQTIHTEAGQLTRNVVDVLSTDRNHTIQSALATIQRHAAEAMAELKHRRTQLAQDIAGLKSIQTDLDALADQNKNFKQIAKNLKMVGLNISIESARSEAAKATFQALSEEISQLAQTVHTVAGLIRDDTDAARLTMDAIQAETRTNMQHLDDLLASAEAMVKNALCEVETLMGLTAKMLDGIGLKAREIGDQVGHLVVGIQIHDNISQRAAHIHSSIEEALDILETSAMIDLPPPAMSVVLGRIYGINRLQGAHLKIIADDVAKVHRQTESSLDALLSAVQTVARPEGLDASAGNAVCRFDSESSTHPVAMLKRALAQLLMLFDQGLEDIQRLDDAREQTARTVVRMRGHIDRVSDINFDIRLKALNAVIKSARLGAAGKAIEAIVIEMKDLAEQSNTTIRSATDIMESIAAASDHMERTGRSQETGGDSAGGRLRSGIESFSTACTAFKQQSRETLDQGRRLQEKIADSRRKIGFFERLLKVCHQHHSELQASVHLLQPFADAACEEWREEEKSILARYTMQRERDAHRQVFNSAALYSDDLAQIAGEAVKAEAGTVENEEFDENVELF